MLCDQSKRLTSAKSLSAPHVRRLSATKNFSRAPRRYRGGADVTKPSATNGPPLRDLLEKCVRTVENKALVLGANASVLSPAPTPER